MADAVAFGSALAYLSSVIDAFECPMRLARVLGSIPLETAYVAKLCLRSWKVTVFLFKTPWSFKAFAKARQASLILGGFKKEPSGKPRTNSSSLNSTPRFAHSDYMSASRFARSFIRSFGQLGIARRLLMLLGPLI